MSQKSAERPLSPHLQVYRPQMTSVLSILHRITGAALAVGSLMLLWWLIAAASGEDAYNTFAWFCGTKLGVFMIFGWSVCLFYHLANGIRHLFWDMGFLFKIENAQAAGWAVLAFTVLMTAGSWMCFFSKG